MQLNAAPKHSKQTAGGSPAFPHIKPIDQLRRSVLSCLLWESEFYEDGKSIAEKIEEAALAVSPGDLAALAIEARSVHNLRHAPLLLLAVLAKTGSGKKYHGMPVADAIAETVQRADELAEFLAVYWRNGKCPLSKQVKVGLARAFQKFDAYALAKYDRAKAVKLRDVAFLVHAKPKDQEQALLWARVFNKERFPTKYAEQAFKPEGEFSALESPDTWEVALSAGKDKRETFTRLLVEGQLGYLALLRNLRNMTEAGVDSTLIRDAILARKGARRVLPFRYIAAARACPQMEPAIDQALSEAISDMPPLPGRTVVMVDVSGSMDAKLSERSDLTRRDAAAALAAIINGDVRMFSFADQVMEVPPRRGMAGVDAIVKSQRGGTRLFDAVAMINAKVPYDRLVVVTDEQDTGGNVRALPNPVGRGYMINVASNRNGVGYGAWTHIDGFSEGVLRWVVEAERVAEAA